MATQPSLALFQQLGSRGRISLKDPDWFELEGGWVKPFSFDEKAKTQILQESQKHILVPQDLETFFKALENCVEVHIHLQESSSECDDRKETIAKLNKIINGLTKSIDALNSLDGVSKELFAQHNYLSAKELFGWVEQWRWRSNPTNELKISLEAAKHQLKEIKSVRYKRNESPRFLVYEIVKRWKRYTNLTRDTDKAKFAWRDHQSGKTNVYTSLWLVVRTALNSSGTYIEDPSNYIVEAIEGLNHIELYGEGYFEKK